MQLVVDQEHLQVLCCVVAEELFTACGAHGKVVNQPTLTNLGCGNDVHDFSSSDESFNHIRSSQARSKVSQFVECSTQNTFCNLVAWKLVNSVFSLRNFGKPIINAFLDLADIELRTKPQVRRMQCHLIPIPMVDQPECFKDGDGRITGKDWVTCREVAKNVVPLLALSPERSRDCKRVVGLAWSRELVVVALMLE